MKDRNTELLAIFNKHFWHNNSEIHLDQKGAIQALNCLIDNAEKAAYAHGQSDFIKAVVWNAGNNYTHFKASEAHDIIYDANQRIQAIKTRNGGE